MEILKTVVNKLFEFMHETHEGFKIWLVTLLLRLPTSVKHFVAVQANETEPFINEIIREIQQITEDLQPQQVHTSMKHVGLLLVLNIIKLLAINY